VDKNSWVEFNIRGSVLRWPRILETKKYDTIVFDCTLKTVKDIEQALKFLKHPGRILLVVPSKESNFPEEAGKVWDEEALRALIGHICKFSKLKQKLFFKCYPEINNGYVYFYIALVVDNYEL